MKWGARASGEWAAQEQQKILGSGQGLGLRLRFELVPLRGSGGRRCVLWMLEVPRMRQGLGKEENDNQGPKASGRPPRTRL